MKKKTKSRYLHSCILQKFYKYELNNIIYYKTLQIYSSNVLFYVFWRIND